MKRISPIIILFLAFLPSTILLAQNVGINNTGAAAHASAMLDVSSTNKGMLAPRMTTALRTAIISPAKGLLVYDTDINSLFHFNGTSWVNLSSGGGGFSLPFVASENLNTDVFKITNSGTGAAISATTTNEFGFALAGISTSAYGYGVYGYAGASDAVAVYGFAGDATALRGHSTGGLGLDARSTNNSAIKASILLGANANPTILATHAGAGIAVDASSAGGTTIRGISGTGVGVRGESNTNTGIGVLGYSNNNVGVSAGTLGGTAVLASAVGGTALKGNSSSGYALDISGKVKIAGGNTNPSNGAVLTSIDASGNAVWKSSQVAFKVEDINGSYRTIPNNTTRRMYFSTEKFDYGNNFNLFVSGTPSATHSTFTIPVNGLYHFDAQLYLAGDSYADIELTDIYLKRNRGGVITTLAESNAVLMTSGTVVTDWAVLQFSTDERLQQGDFVWIEVNYKGDLGDGNIFGSVVNNFFNGHLVFAD